MSVFSIGCKKDSNKPSAEQAVAKFTVTSTTFKDGVVDHAALKDIVSPQLSWDNVPKGTKQLVVIMDGGKHVYWNDYIKNESTSLKENELGRDGGFKVPDPNKDMGGTTATLELLALNCTADEIEKKFQKAKIEKTILDRDIDQTRAGVRKIFDKLGLSHVILGSSTISFVIKKQAIEKPSEAVDHSPKPYLPAENGASIPAKVENEIPKDFLGEISMLDLADNNMGSDDKFKLSATPNLPEEAYNWEFSIDNGSTWSAIPNAYGKPNIAFTGYELMGNKFDNLYGKGNIFCRVHPKKGGYKIATPKRSAPHVVSITPIPNTCGKTDGSIRIQFDRALGQEEVLHLSLSGGVDDEYNMQKVKLESNNTLVWTKELAAGNYELTMMGSHGASYTDGDKHKSSIHLTAPSCD